MSKFKPLDFQTKAIEKLTKAFIRLWENTENQRRLVFKSPTGSGKTFMVSHFLHGLNALPNWDYDKAIIWITFSEELAMQSKEKFAQYFAGNLENSLITVNDFKQGKLYKNNILFINWQKLVSQSADTRVIRRPDDEMMRKEQGYYFEDILENTKKEGREIIMIIDESHTHLSDLAQTSVIDVVDPKVIVNVSATPKTNLIPNREEEDEGKGAFVYVSREDVVKEGLIKEKIVVQTDEDLHKYKKKDLDELLIDLAIEKRLELKKEFESLGKKINPLVLIQLPNDDNKLKESGEETKETIVLNYLQKRNIDVEKRVALWFDGKQKNMEHITYDESDVDFMLFKQAAGTGWDCPRAHILVMFREINSATFYKQTIGRILRTPEPNQKDDYKDNPNLRTGFLYTNYTRNEVGVPDQSENNKPFVYTAYRRKDIENLKNLYSDFVSRIDYGDLGNAIKFQMSFLKSFDDFFNITDQDHPITAREKIEQAGIDVQPTLTNKIIVNAEFSDYDKLNLDFKKKGEDEDYEMSRNDVEKLFNYNCYNLLTEQTDVKARITNIARSWSPLKSAFRVWFKRYFDSDSDLYYRIIINDLNKGSASKIRPALTEALKNFYPIRKEFLEERKEEIEKREAPQFEIKEEYSYTEDYAVLNEDESTYALSALQPFYLKKKYKGRENELNFIKYLEQQDKHIDWWFKNGDNGKEYYSLKYFNSGTKEFALFYPDWIVKFKNGTIGIFDTKGGNTAQNPDGRALGLANKLKELNKGKVKYIGGLVINEGNQWFYFDNEEYKKTKSIQGEDEKDAEKSKYFEYDYTKGKLNRHWKPFSKLF